MKGNFKQKSVPWKDEENEKIVLAMAAASVGFSASARKRKYRVCIRPLRKAGDSYKMMEEWALAAKAGVLKLT